MMRNHWVQSAVASECCFCPCQNKKRYLCWGAGGCSRLSVRLLIPAQVMISGSRDGAPRWAQQGAA